MRNQIASEFRKLTTTRSIYAMLAGLMAVVAIGTVAIVTDGHPADLLGPLQQQPFLHVSLTIAPLFGLLLGLRSFTDEFRFGSIVPTLLASPVRRRVLGAKLVAVGGGGVVLSLAAMAGHDRRRRAAPARQGPRRHVVDEPLWRWSSDVSSVRPCCGPRSGSGWDWRSGTRWRRSPGRWSGSWPPRASCPAWCRTSPSTSPARRALRSSASMPRTC